MREKYQNSPHMHLLQASLRRYSLNVLWFFTNPNDCVMQYPGEKVDEISPKFHQNSTEIPMEFHRKNTVKFGHNTSRFLCNITEISLKYHHNFSEISENSTVIMTKFITVI